MITVTDEHINDDVEQTVKQLQSILHKYNANNDAVLMDLAEILGNVLFDELENRGYITFEDAN